MSLRFHEISEANHRILNPFSEEKFALVGEICQLSSDQRILDLACGKGEMLCQWSRRHGVEGLGVDISTVFLAAAKERAAELGVDDRIHFKQADARKYVAQASSYDVVSCIGATWIGGGPTGTLELMKPALVNDGLLLVGEPYWIEEPPKEALTSLGVEPDTFTSLVGTMERFADAGCELIEMVLAHGDSWDRYVAGQWRTLSGWLRDHLEDPDAPEVRKFLEQARRSHLAYQRRYLGWGVFVLRPS